MSTDFGIPITPPRPAMSYEEMWFQVKAHIAGLVMDRKTPQEIFNVRELMGELERERVKPLEQYVALRKVVDNGTSPRAATRRSRLAARNSQQRAVLALAQEPAQEFGDGALNG